MTRNLVDETEEAMASLEGAAASMADILVEARNQGKAPTKADFLGIVEESMRRAAAWWTTVFDSAGIREEDREELKIAIVRELAKHLGETREHVNKPPLDGVMTKAFAWMSNPQYLAQVGHTLGGYALVFTVGAFTSWSGAAWVLLVGVLVAALKEFLFDVAPWGEGDSWRDSLQDFAFYVLGGAVGFGVAVLFHMVRP